MKLGRNDLCHCGSGKKFKHCCLIREQAVTPEELVRRRVRRATDQLIAPLMREAADLYGPEGFDWAWEDFCLRDDEPYDAEAAINQIFLSWFLHDWVPEFEDDADTMLSAGITIAQSYLDRVGAKLEPIAQRYLQTCCATPFSFFEVLQVRPGSGFLLREVMLGAEVDVLERRGSEHVSGGDILYAKIIAIEGIAIVEALAPHAFQPDRKLPIIELRRRLRDEAERLSADVLRERADEIRALYLNLAEELERATLPQMHNTDGDPIEMYTLNFDLDAPGAAFDALKDLTLDMTDEDFAQAAERDAAGRLLRAELSWARRGNALHKAWDNTSLGRIVIEGNRLTAEVNSANRAAALRRLIEQRLGDSAHVKPSVVQSMQQMLAHEPTPEAISNALRGEGEHARLARDPRVQAVMKELLRKHYAGWIDEKLPVLGGLSPREAVRDPDGREAVEALVTQIERNGERTEPPMDGALIVELRRELGLRGAI